MRIFLLFRVSVVVDINRFHVSVAEATLMIVKVGGLYFRKQLTT